MGQEIERKFLLRSDAWRAGARGKRYRQGYLCIAKERTVRIRTIGDAGFLTIKGPSHGAARAEYEYAIPFADAEEMLDSLCERPLIEKTRHRIEHEGLVWEVDEFHGENAGLVVAEVELPRADHPVVKPGWIGEEVTSDPRYFNASLVKHPFKTW